MRGYSKAVYRSRPVRVLGTILCCIWLPSIGDGAARPNVVLILCDDMGWSDLGCYGGEVDSRHLDQLARDGLRFTQFYNNAKCTTTRASLLTGLYPRPKNQLLQTDMLTLGEAMRRAGYRTALSGKWHLGRDETTHPVRRGFDQFYGLLDGCCNFFDPSLPDPKYKGSRIRYFARNQQRITSFPSDFYTTDAFTDEAIRMLRDFAADRQTPFFLHLCYTAPHYPLHAKPADIAKYRGKFMHGWDEMRRRRRQRQIKMGLINPRWQMSTSDSRGYAWESADHDFEDQRMAVYAAMIDAMDQNIGRLLATLDELQFAENTIVMFLSDNGGCAEEPGGRDPAVRRAGPKDDYVAVGPSWGWAQNAPFRRYKSWAHEGGISTPLIVRWPGKTPPGTITNEAAHIIDLMPTCLELAGVDYPRAHGGRLLIPLEGSSLAPILKGGERSDPVELYWEWSGNAAVRQGRWKAVWDKLVGHWELYNLEADRTETNDLAAAEPDRVRRLALAYDRWAGRTGNRRVQSLPERRPSTLAP